MALRTRRDSFEVETGIVVGEIGKTSHLVEKLTGYSVQQGDRGRERVRPRGGIHQDGMLKDAKTYQIMDPTELGLVMTLPLGKHSGRHAFALACAEAGSRSRATS